MGLFRRRGKPQAIVDGSVLRIERPSGLLVETDLSASPWLGFLQVGDDAAPVYEGWWLLGTPTGAVAVKDDCPRVDQMLRGGELAAAADAVPEKFVLLLMSRPMMLRGRDARDGVVELDAEQASALRAKGTTEPAARIADLPVVA